MARTARCSQRDVEAAFNLSRSTTTNILQLMEKNGIIRREGVDYDARLKRLVPTEKAVQMEEQVRECARLLEQRITRGLTDEQRAQLFAHGRVHGRKPERIRAARLGALGSLPKVCCAVFRAGGARAEEEL